MPGMTARKLVTYSLPTRHRKRSTAIKDLQEEAKEFELKEEVKKVGLKEEVEGKVKEEV